MGVVRMDDRGGWAAAAAAAVDGTATAPPGISRRALLAVGAAALAVPIVADPALAGIRATTSASAVRSGAGAGAGSGAARVIAEAEGAAGMRLEGSPWMAPSAFGWSALFASWLLRDHGLPAIASPRELFAHHRIAGRTHVLPEPGSLVFYSPGGDAEINHVGIVTSMSGGAAQTIEGDVPGELPSELTFVRRFSEPWSDRVVFATPDYRTGGGRRR